MKRSLVFMLSMLFLAGTAMVWADATGTSKTVKTHKHHKKPKTELNPQPLPPRKVPVDASSTGPGGRTTGPNTNQ